MFHDNGEFLVHCGWTDTSIVILCFSFCVSVNILRGTGSILLCILPALTVFWSIARFLEIKLATIKLHSICLWTPWTSWHPPQEIQRDEGQVQAVKVELNPGGSVKTTKLKLTWLSQSDELVDLCLVDFDYLINKKKVRRRIWENYGFVWYGSGLVAYEFHLRLLVLWRDSMHFSWITCKGMF